MPTCYGGGPQMERIGPSTYQYPSGLVVYRVRNGGVDRYVREANQKVRNRRAAEGWFDVVKEDGNEWIDTPPSASPAALIQRTIERKAPERAFMLTERFRKTVHRLPADCVAEAKAGSSLSSLQYGTGQVLVKRALRGLEHLPAFLIVPEEPHPDHRKAVEALGVKVVVP
jgi:hypothetical protein